MQYFFRKQVDRHLISKNVFAQCYTRQPLQIPDDIYKFLYYMFMNNYDLKKYLCFVGNLNAKKKYL